MLIDVYRYPYDDFKKPEVIHVAALLRHPHFIKAPLIRILQMALQLPWMRSSTLPKKRWQRTRSLTRARSRKRLTQTFDFRMGQSWWTWLRILGRHQTKPWRRRLFLTPSAKLCVKMDRFGLGFGSCLVSCVAAIMAWTASSWKRRRSFANGPKTWTGSSSWDLNYFRLFDLSGCSLYIFVC